MLLMILLIPCVRVLAEDNVGLAEFALTPDRTGTVVKKMRVVIDAHPDRQPFYTAIAKRIIAIRQGDRLTASAVENAIEALKLSQRFSDIHVDAISEAQGEVLIFTLTPYRYIEDIRIRGKYPLFERDILNQMTLYPGDPYTRADLSAQTGAIVERYRREGYINPQVSVTAQPAPDSENAVIVVNIDKGPHYTLGGLKFEGNQNISAGALKWRMKVWRSALLPGIGRFSQFRLKKDMDAVLKYYRRKGYADAELSYHIEVPAGAYRPNVSVQVKEGRRYTTTFEGNQQFWNLTLKKDVALFTDGNRNNVGMRKSIQKMKNRYRAAGYLDVRIKAETKDLSDDTADIRQVRFMIQEGPQTVVDTVSIEGNQTLAETQIKKQILTRPPSWFHNGALVPETLDEDSYAVTTLYMKQGFQERTVTPEVTYNEDKSGAAVSMIVDEGPRTIVRSITIRGLTVLPETAAMNVMVHQVGDPFRNAAMEVEKDAIASLVSEKGYPHASVDARVTFSEDRTQADIVHVVNAGPQVTLGDIFISGNLRTKQKVIRRELEVQTGTPLSLRQLHDGQRQLRDLAIFHGVSYRTFGLKEKEETVNLFVEVEENKPYYAQVSGGYESDSGFFGRTRVGDRNLLGLNKDLWAGAEISETGYRVETRLTEPRFLGTKTTASIGAFNEELTEFNQPFGTRTTGGSLGFGRKWRKKITAALSFSLDQRDQFRVDDRPTDLEEEETRTIFVATPYINYDSRDSFVRPTKGFFGSLGVDISKGINNDLDDFVRYLFDTRYYTTPVDGFTLAALARIGQVLSYSDNDQVPDDQLFFLGGIRDVRGFKENLLRFDRFGDPVGGRTAVVGSLEARIDLGMNLELTAFADIGSIQDALSDEGSDRFRPSVGIGLRYITPIGPMGVLYGHKLDPKDGESSGRFHVSIGYSF